MRGYRGLVQDVAPIVARVKASATPVLLLRADRVYGRDHLVLAARLAAKALDEGRARATDVATETALYAAGERQIGKALAFAGLHPGAREVAAIAWDRADAVEAIASELRWSRDDGVLEGDARALAAFGVTDQEREMFPRERWGDLILERVALVDVLKA